MTALGYCDTCEETVDIDLHDCKDDKSIKEL